jgi:hypothetical protein
MALNVGLFMSSGALVAASEAEVGSAAFNALLQWRKDTHWKPRKVDRPLMGKVAKVGGRGGGGLQRSCGPCTFWFEKFERFGGSHTAVCKFCQICWRANKEKLEGIQPKGHSGPCRQ